MAPFLSIVLAFGFFHCPWDTQAKKADDTNRKLLWDDLPEDFTVFPKDATSGHNNIATLYQKGVSWQPTPLDQCVQESDSSDIIMINETVLINFSGSPNDISESDINILEESFLSAYEEFGDSICFEIINVTIDTSQEEIGEADRHLLALYFLEDRESSAYQSESISNAPSESPTAVFTFNFSLFFSIIFQCFFCPKEAELFANYASRRRELDMIKTKGGFKPALSRQQRRTKSVNKQRLVSLRVQENDSPDQNKPRLNGMQQFQEHQGGGNIMFSNQNQYQPSGWHRRLDNQCSAKNPEFCTAPDRMAFTQRYNEILPPVPAIAEVVESLVVRKYPCASVESRLETSVTISLEGDYGYLSRQDAQDEIEVLENIVKRAYNTMGFANAETCDLLFRRVNSVRYVSVEQMTESIFSMSFDVGYKCLGCDQDGTPLFDTITNSTYMERQNLNVDFREDGPVEIPCSCGTIATQNRSITFGEYTQALRQMVRVRQGQQKLTFVSDIVGDTTDSENDFEEVAIPEEVASATSTTGTSNPTTGRPNTSVQTSQAPSLPPTVYPSLMPSHFPSLTPSATPSSFMPSYSPSAIPSLVPSSMPTNLPTVECHGKCDPFNQICIDGVCHCKDGFISPSGRGGRCQDIPECNNKAWNNCHRHAYCTEKLGGYTCTCKEGYEGNGEKCTDINECASFPGICGNSDCMNTNGSYKCIVQTREPTRQPTRTPTRQPAQISTTPSVFECPVPQHNGCSICGARKCVREDATIMDTTCTYFQISCKELEEKGFSGAISPDECAELARCISVCECA